MEGKFKNPKKISPALLVILSFIGVMLIGAFLITTPIARTPLAKQTYGEWGNFVDSVFMATSATCVTGFDCYPMGLVNTINLFGQIVLCICMQIGGLGFMTVFFFFLTLIRKKLSFEDRFFISQAVNSTDVADVKKFLVKILVTTGIFEGIGFLLMLVPMFSLFGYNGEAVWNAFFHTISAFNNSGLDLFGTTSFIREGNELLTGMQDWAYYFMCTVVMLLVLFGGISYFVIFDVFTFKKKPHQWTAFTKIAILMMVTLNIGGMIYFIFSDGIKGSGSLPVFDALFLAVSSRTAGFATYDPYALSTPGRIFNDILMFIGGSPLGTASGIKTTTLFIIILTIFNYLRGESVHAFKRYYSKDLIAKSMLVFISSLFIVLIGYLVLAAFESNNVNQEGIFSGERCLFETISAFSTTGFTTLMTVQLSAGGKLTCVVLMFLGRLGPITLFSIFSKNMHIKEDKHVKYVEEDVLIG